MRRRALPRDAVRTAEAIVDEMEQGGLEAALKYSERLDGVRPKEAVARPADVGGDADVINAALEAARSLEAFYRKLAPRDVVDAYGEFLRMAFWKPVRSAAFYIPARYISTLVMLAVPARIAGVEEIYVVTPPKGVTAELLTLAHKLGVRGVVQLGGAHGLAYTVYHIGVDFVAGPGGLYVQAAKYVLSQSVGIDGIEGPTELVVYAEGVSADRAVKGALAQLEHGPTSFAYILSRDAKLLEETLEIYKREKTSSMGPLEVRRVSSLEEAARLIDEIAPEHLEVWGAPSLAYTVRNAGAISVDVPSPYLDYVAGVSHVLPTGGSAKWRGILTPMTFMKAIGVVAPIQAPDRLKKAAEILARYEGFKKHEEAL